MLPNGLEVNTAVNGMFHPDKAAQQIMEQVVPKY